MWESQRTGTPTPILRTRALASSPCPPAHLLARLPSA